MDRVTASRNFRHVPNRLAHMALDGVNKVRVNTTKPVAPVTSNVMTPPATATQ
jgi:UDP-glucose 4-epimerase